MTLLRCFKWRCVTVDGNKNIGITWLIKWWWQRPTLTLHYRLQLVPLHRCTSLSNHISVAEVSRFKSLLTTTKQLLFRDMPPMPIARTNLDVHDLLNLSKVYNFQVVWICWNKMRFYPSYFTSIWLVKLDRWIVLAPKWFSDDLLQEKLKFRKP